MYSMFMFLGLLAVWAQAMAIRTGRARYWLWWVAFSAALGWTEYFGLFQVLVQQLVWLGVLWRGRHRPGAGRAWRNWLLASAAMLLLVAPAVAFAAHQFLLNQNSGKGFGGPSQVGAGAAGSASGVSVYSVLANLLWAGIGYHSNSAMAQLGALWPLGILASLLVLGRRHRGETKLVVACIAGPLLLDVALAVFKPTLLDVRYVSGLVPLLVVLLARVVTGCTRRQGSAWLACGLLACVLGYGLYDQQSNGSNPRRYDFQRAVTTVVHHWHGGDRILYDPSDLGEVIDYYAPGRSRAPLQTAKTQPPAHGTLWVLTSRSLMSKPGDRYRLHLLLTHLERHDHRVAAFHVPNVEVSGWRR